MKIRIKDFDRFRVRFREFGGWRLVWQYARMGALTAGCRELLRCALDGRSLKAAYPAITHRVNEQLLAQYHYILEESGSLEESGEWRVESEEWREESGEWREESGEWRVERGEWRVESGERNSLAQSEKRRAKPKIIWTTWLQGEEEAPKVMKACWRSWRRHLPDYELRIVTLDNHRQWADLPEELIEKYRRGIMPPALLSDVLRLDLLTRHGGTWIDGTVLCTGFAAERLQRQWAAVEASPLCLFRYFEQGRKEATGMSTWFISASPGHAVLTAARNMLVAYWRDYNCTLNYYLPHLFISAALDRHPHVVATMPRLNSRFSLLLGAALTSPFDAEAWRDLTDHVAFHKLNFRKVTAEAQAPGTYCSFLLEGEGD